MIESPENYMEFNYEKVSYLRDRLVFIGFWQHWKYLQLTESLFLDEIIEFMNFKIQVESLVPFGSKYLVVHVRRGDYLKRGNFDAFGVISPDSYRKLIAEIKEQYVDLEVLTLTDDELLQDNVEYGEEFGRIITPSHCSPWQALKIMSGADVVIAANSTLSWWGAVLSLKNGGKGFIPNSFHKNLDTKDAFDFPGLFKYENSHI